MMKLAAFLCLLAVASAIPAIKVQVEVDLDAKPPAPVPPPTCPYNVSSECLADSCCNWCVSPFNASAGFCMESIPYPMPGMQCMKTPTECKTMLDMASCDANDSCAWLPMGPTGAGLCVYNWDKCKVPKDMVKAEKPKPKPTKLKCNMKTEEACDDHSCCHWCEPPAVAGEPKTPGFCMKIGFDIPSMTCKKSKPDCKDMNSAKHCEKLGSCKWVPFGPPGSKNGPGMCAFDMGACKFKPEEEEEFSF